MSTTVCLTLLGISLSAIAITGLVSYTNFNGVVPYDYITVGFGLLFFAVAMLAVLAMEII